MRITNQTAPDFDGVRFLLEISHHDMRIADRFLTLPIEDESEMLHQLGCFLLALSARKR